MVNKADIHRLFYGQYGHLHTPVLVYDSSYSIIYANHSACALLNTELGDYSNSKYSEIIAGVSISAFPSIIKLENGNEYRLNFSSFEFNGADYISIEILETDATDITEEKDSGLTRAELHSLITDNKRRADISRNIFKVLFDSLYDAVLIHDPDGRLLDANQRALELYGIRQNDFFFDVDIIYENLMPSQRLPQLWHSVVNGTPAFFEMLTKNPSDGKPLHTEIYLSRMDLIRGPAIMVSIRDITDRKRVQLEIQKALQREKELNEMKSSFVSMISHEYRTPLATITLSVDLLSRYSDRIDDAKKEETYGRIRKAIQQMTDLLQDIITLEKTRSKKVDLNLTDINLDTWLNQLAEDMEFLTSGQNEIISELAEEGLSLKADERILRQMIANLVSNAIKYSPENSPIKITAAKEDDRILIRVIDQGHGISEKDRVHLFEPFFRARNVSNVSGTGLGLAIVRESADLHGGSVELEKTGKGGSVFAVKLPVS